jgi:Flp pilus assembly protein TadG
VERDRGSVLLLFPAAFMVVLVLGALAIDASAVFLRQRDLASAAGAAANDAATLGLDREHLRAEGVVWLDPDVVEAAVLDSLNRRGVLSELLEPPLVEVVGDRRVVVTLVAHASYVIAPALPGSADGRTVRVTVRVDAVLDDGG